MHRTSLELRARQRWGSINDPTRASFLQLPKWSYLAHRSLYGGVPIATRKPNAPFIVAASEPDRFPSAVRSVPTRPANWNEVHIYGAKRAEVGTDVRPFNPG